MNYYGSICLSDIPREQMKAAENGKVYVNVRIVERREVGKFGDTHFISCSPKKEEQKEGVNYIIGNVKPSVERVETPSVNAIAQAPALEQDVKLPWE